MLIGQEHAQFTAGRAMFSDDWHISNQLKIFRAGQSLLIKLFVRKNKLCMIGFLSKKETFFRSVLQVGAIHPNLTKRPFLKFDFFEDQIDSCGLVAFASATKSFRGPYNFTSRAAGCTSPAKRIISFQTNLNTGR